MEAPKSNIVVHRNTAIVTAKAMDNPVAGLLHEDVPEGSWIFGFDAMNPANESLVFACDADATREWTQHVERPFMLQTWSAKRITLESSDDKGMITAVRVVLIDPELETLSFVSVGAVASLDLIRTLRGDGPYDPPIPVVVKQVKTRGGFYTYKLRVITSSSPA